MAAMSNRLSKAKRIVVKVGSALLVDQQSGTIKGEWLSTLVDDLVALKKSGADVILVSSGAIAMGRRTLGLSKGKLKLDQSQAAAAVGQIALAHAWATALAARSVVAAQVLVTLTDTEDRQRYLNARATLSTLLKQSAVPVINENDTVATMMSADVLVLLSDIDGLYSAPPNQKGAKFISEITTITPEIEAMAGKPISGVGSGGMITKIEAAKISLSAGCNMVIASGHELHPLKRIMDGERCSWFLAEASALQARKRWIAGTLAPTGRLIVDDGAMAALGKGKSLLPAGVKSIEGTFVAGDTVSIVSSGGEFARGLVGYDSDEARKIVGLKSADVQKLMGEDRSDELVHRDDLVML